jgi:hypothetical protein
MSFISSEFDSVFKKAISALQPYLNDIVCIGGCATALYRYHKLSNNVPWDFIGTFDFDAAVPQKLSQINRAPVAEIMRDAGFTEKSYGTGNMPVIKYVQGDSNNAVDIEFLCDISGLSRKKQKLASIEVQEGLTAQPLRYLAMSLENTWSVQLATIPDFRDLKNISVKVPNPAAYIVSKVLVGDEKRSLSSFKKDCFYIYEVSTIFRNAPYELHKEYDRLSPCTPNWKRRFRENARNLYATESSEGVVNAVDVFRAIGELQHNDFELTEEIVCRSVNKMLDALLN